MGRKGHLPPGGNEPSLEASRRPIAKALRSQNDARKSSSPRPSGASRAVCYIRSPMLAHAPRRRFAPLARSGAWVALLVSAVGCDGSAQYCGGSGEVSAERFVHCEKSCLKGNQASCARERELEGRLCHEEFSVYHCMRACNDGDALACARAKAVMR